MEKEGTFNLIAHITNRKKNQQEKMTEINFKLFQKPTVLCAAEPPYC